MTFILDWLADYGFLLAGGLMILSCICMIIMVIMLIQAHNEYVDDEYDFGEEDEDDIRRRDNDTAILMATVAIVCCI